MDRLGGVNGGGGGGERTPLLGQGVGFLYFVFSFCMQPSATEYIIPFLLIVVLLIMFKN
jgi:hypothetical protein